MMKSLLFAFGLALIVLPNVSAAEKASIWQTSYKQALELAAEKNLPVLLYFTGSDWCPPCIEMDKRVFSKPEFAKFAEGRFVPLLVDLPRAKPQDPKISLQNEQLTEKFDTQGIVPTLILLHPKGQIMERHIGGMSGLKAFTSWVEKGLK